jgi:hypothetical protein
MTKLLDRAVEAARNVPPDTQDDIAHVLSGWRARMMNRQYRSRPKSSTQ